MAEASILTVLFDGCKEKMHAKININSKLYNSLDNNFSIDGKENIEHDFINFLK